MKKLLTLALAVASLGFVPSAAEAKTAETPSTSMTANAGAPQIRIRIGQPRRNRRNYRGYRNYGQWRRNQMGNRRARFTTQTYWRNGRRYTRTVRVY
jgi:hypothetical protein